MSLNVMSQNHRSYQNRLPVQSKFLAYKWDHIKYGIHRRRLTEVKKQVDNNIPYSMSLKFNTNIKKECLGSGAAQNDEAAAETAGSAKVLEQQEKIDKENKRLHSKMIEIDSKTGLIRYIEHSGPKRFSSFKNHHYKMEMQRVARENQRLLNRITLNEPIISSCEMEKDYSVNHCKFAGNITRFPKSSKSTRPCKSAGNKSLLEELEQQKDKNGIPNLDGEAVSEGQS